jgi:hypothetical protein
MTTEQPVWHFTVECVGCHRTITTAVVDPTRGDRIISFAGPGKLELNCPLCGRVAQYSPSALTSKPDEAPG